MSVVAKLTGFAALLVVAFVAAGFAGRAINPDKPAGLTGSDQPAHGGESMEMASDGDASAAAHEVRGLAVADHGVRLVVDNPQLRRGVEQRIAFRIVDAAGETVRSFAPTHTKRMHMILVRRDLVGFQHLHPKMSEDGTWSTTVSIDHAGAYRLFADFMRDDEPVTLASDVGVDGPFDLKPLPAAESSAIADGGYDVRVDNAGVRAGEPASLRFAVTDHGRPVAVQQYLGAAGHLVALRDGDLAFLHVHPEEHADGGKGSDRGNGKIAFEATFPTTGSYRLFLQFKVNGRVQTVAFTQEVK